MDELLTSAPPEVRDPILRGIKWTVWFSVLSVPFSYATNAILARTGPDVIGTYGILLIYINVVSVFLYLGGNSVPIRFVSECERPEDKVAFLQTYFLIVCLCILPWLTIARLRPNLLVYIFGNSGGVAFQQAILWLSPLYIFYCIIFSALRGLLDLKFAATVERVVTIAIFFVYFFVFLTARRLLATRYVFLIWGIYLGAIFIAALVAAARFKRLNSGLSVLRTPGFFIPRGFWKYTLTLQSSSALGFLGSKLDFILLLNFGGLEVLGRYVVITTICYVIPRTVGFLMDSMLPSLITTVAKRDFATAKELTQMYCRMVLPTCIAGSLFVLFFAKPLVGILGRNYLDLVPLVRFAAAISAVQVLNGFTGTVLNACGLPQYDTIMKIFRTVLYVGAFPTLWRHFGLGGAVLIWGICELAYQAASIIVIRRVLPYYFSFGKNYFAFWTVIPVAVVTGLYHGPYALAFHGALWVILVATFLFVGRYTIKELLQLSRILAPKRNLISFRNEA